MATTISNAFLINEPAHSDGSLFDLVGYAGNYRVTLHAIDGASANELERAINSKVSSWTVDNAPAGGMGYEEKVMPAICSHWVTRATSIELPKKGERRERDREAFMEGAIAALLAMGAMTRERSGMIAFLAAAGRLSEYMQRYSTEAA